MDTSRKLLSCLGLLALFVVIAQASREQQDIVHLTGAHELGIRVNTSSGTYDLTIAGETWMRSSATVLHTTEGWFISAAPKLNVALPNGIAAQELVLKGSRAGNGTDDLGFYNSFSLTWAANSVSIITKFMLYTEWEAVQFEQQFINGVANASVGSNTQVVSGFPSFSEFTQDFRFLSYKDTFAYPQTGAWNRSPFAGGITGGSPLALFRKDLRTIVMSPLSNYMVGSQIVTSDLGHKQALYAGLQGRLEVIPPGFSHSTLLVAGKDVTSTFKTWGESLLTRGHKSPAKDFSDVGIQYLGYWTDNGAYYYYNTEKGKNYEQTMTDISTYVDNIGLPVHYYQMDSWWYYKLQSNQALILWEAMPSVYPNGMEAVIGALGYKPLILHNRYFSNVSDYEGQYTFINEKNGFALPLDQKMFEYIMAKAHRWGMSVYEQDWLVTVYMTMDATQTSAFNANNWLLAMGRAAQSVGVTIQYCMPLPIHLLASTQLQSVTQARVTTDYGTAARNDQWKIGYGSLLHWALGLVPFKDDFWSSEGMQEGCPYKDMCWEPNPELQALVSTLSSGPVGPSDSIGMLNKTRIMQTCRVDGLLLKADKPATPLDSVYASQFDNFLTTDFIELWHSHTDFTKGGDLQWHYVFGAGLAAPYTLHTKDFGNEARNYYALNYYDQRKPVPFTARTPVTLPKGPQNPQTKVIPFSYYIIAPVLQNNWVFFGEQDKFITASRQRFTSLSETSDGIVTIGMQGVANESVNLLFLRPGTSDTYTLSCTFPSSGLAWVVCSGNSCACRG